MKLIELRYLYAGFALMLAGIQIGGNNIVSVNFLAFVLTGVTLLRGALLRRPDVVLLAAICFLASSLPYLSADDFLQTALRSARWLVAFLFVAQVMGADVRLPLAPQQVARGVLYFQAALLAICVIQRVALEVGAGSHVFLPWEWFGGTAGDETAEGTRRTTLASYWLEVGAEKRLALGDELTVRPSATYAEPSYVGFVSLSLTVVFHGLAAGVAARLRFLAVALATTLVCGTASGSILVIGYAAYVHRGRLARSPAILALAAVGTLAAAAAGAFDRLLAIHDFEQEASGYVRLVQPLLNIQALIEEGRWLGVPPSLAQEFFGSHPLNATDSAGLDNGLLNLFCYFGIFGFVILWLLKRSLPADLFLFVLMACLFNGSPFAFDKAAVICWVCVLSTPARYAVPRVVYAGTMS